MPIWSKGWHLGSSTHSSPFQIALHKTWWQEDLRRLLGWLFAYLTHISFFNHTEKKVRNDLGLTGISWSELVLPPPPFLLFPSTSTVCSEEAAASLASISSARTKQGCPRLFQKRAQHLRQSMIISVNSSRRPYLRRRLAYNSFQSLDSLSWGFSWRTNSICKRNLQEVM